MKNIHTDTTLATHENPVERVLIKDVLEGGLKRLHIIVRQVRHGEENKERGKQESSLSYNGRKGVLHILETPTTEKEIAPSPDFFFFFQCTTSTQQRRRVRLLCYLA